MMIRLLRFLLVTACLSVTMTVYAAMTPEELYKITQHNLSQISYKTESVTANNTGRTIDIAYQWISPDGIVKTRREITCEPLQKSNPLNPYIVIANEKGRFLVTPKGAVKLNYQSGRKPLNDENLEIKYTIENSSFEGIQCYKLTRRITFNSAAIKAYIESLPSGLRSEPDADDFFPAVEIMLIGQDDLFPREISIYSRKGKLIEKRQLGNLVLNPDLDEKLFDVSLSGMTIVNSIEEYAEATSNLTRQAIIDHSRRNKSKSWASGTLSAIRRGILYNLDTVSKSFAWAGGIIIAILIFAVLFSKMKQRTR